jgi:altronate hydrolase
VFTTGRGTPLGAPVPTLKVSTNSDLYEKKKEWIDFDAGELLNGKSLEDLSKDLLKKIISVANGDPTKNEINGYEEIAIFKDGVIL